LSWLDLRQSWALGISEKIVKKCHLLLYFLNLLCMFVEDMFAHKLRTLGGEGQ
jgi:positive regulator of sigma E activity